MAGNSNKTKQTRPPSLTMSILGKIMIFSSKMFQRKLVLCGPFFSLTWDSLNHRVMNPLEFHANIGLCEHFLSPGERAHSYSQIPKQSVTRNSLRDHLRVLFGSILDPSSFSLPIFLWKIFTLENIYFCGFMISTTSG